MRRRAKLLIFLLPLLFNLNSAFAFELDKVAKEKAIEYQAVLLSGMLESLYKKPEFLEKDGMEQEAFHSMLVSQHAMILAEEDLLRIEESIIEGIKKGVNDASQNTSKQTVSQEGSKRN